MSKKTIKKVQDELTPKILSLYKKKCDINGIPILLLIKQKLQQSIQSGSFKKVFDILQNYVKQLHLYDQQIGSNHPRLLFQSLQQLKYKNLSQISFWNTKIGDQGVRVISKYMTNTQGHQIQLIDLLNNQITKLGCEFLGKALMRPGVRLKVLKLDSNPIKADGLKWLTAALRVNNTLEKLSLKYCNIDAIGSKYIQEIIANIDSNLKSLKIAGNPFQNQGIYQILRAVRTCGMCLQKLNICDVKLNLLSYSPNHQPQSIQSKICFQLLSIIKSNVLLQKFTFHFNIIHDDIAKEILTNVIEQGKNIKKMEMPLNVKYEIRDGLDTVIRERNKKKGGKKKMGKK